MRKLLFLLLFILPAIGICQIVNPTDVSKLEDISSFIKRSAMLNKKIFLNFEKSTSNTSTLDASEISDAIQPFINSKENAEDQALSMRYITALKTYHSKMDQFGSAMEGIFLTDETIPFEFTKFNGSLAFCQNGIFAENTYNTADANAEQRAAKVISDLILPGLSNFKPLADIPDLNYFCLVVAYTVHNFVVENTNDKDNETLAMIIPRSALQKYWAAEISQQEIIKASTIYNINKSTGSEPKKISF